jgi:serine O-acetyltransferase
MSMFFLVHIVRLLGGIWEIKSKINKTRNGILKKFYLDIYYYYLRMSGNFIGHEATFQGVPYIPHKFGIFISGNAEIGKNCIIFQNVTIGANTMADSEKIGAPIIGDSCYIGAGACIIGKIMVGNNCRIGANCTVVKDIPDNSLVVSQASRIIPRDSLNNKYYVKLKDGWAYYNDGLWTLEKDESVLSRLKNV